jgi:hypothetical protein
MMAKHGFKLLKTRSMPYDAPIAHLATRLAQTFGMTGTLKGKTLSRFSYQYLPEL